MTRLWPISPMRRTIASNLRCMNAFETVTIVVTAGAAVLGLIVCALTGSPLSRLGRDGVAWFDHLADLPIDQRPSEDELEAPIPRRPLTGRRCSRGRALIPRAVQACEDAHSPTRPDTPSVLGSTSTIASAGISPRLAAAMMAPAEGAS